MCLPTFGFYKKVFHSEKFAYNHACGNVCPGDAFVTDISLVTCKQCLAKITPVSDEATGFCECGYMAKYPICTKCGREYPPSN